MKRFNFIYKAIFALASIFAGIALSGCDNSFIFDDQEPCPRGIRLKLFYGHHLKGGDALPYEINHVSVYVFSHETGLAVDQVDVPVGNIREREMEVNLDHLDPGVYDFIVWCFGDNKKHFTIKPDKTREDRMEHFTCLMSEDDSNPGHQSNDIGRLYHGQLLNVDCTQDETIVTEEIPLKKDTNAVRLVLQHLNGEYLDPSKFDITLESDNGHVDHNNDIIPGHNRVYHPWDVRSGTTDMGGFTGGDSRAMTTASALVAEHTVGRIMKDGGVRLRVKNNETGEDIINIPMVDYALLVKGLDRYSNKEMDDQEYLDRQDEYNMVFFLDEGLRWMNQYIYINSWRIVLQNNEL